MTSIKDKLIVSIANENYKEIIEIATEYKKIELRLNQLYLHNEQILDIIDSSELVVITDIADLDSMHKFYQISFNRQQLEKIIIDCPVEKIKNLTKYIENTDVKKILSYHQWTNIEKIEYIFPNILEKIGTNISKYSIIKIVVLVENIGEWNKLFSIFTEYPNFDFILIPLGKKFQRVRIKSLELGSKYMFCYVNNPITNCQLHYREYL
jgi:3-dehydroquinate dehydratase